MTEATDKGTLLRRSNTPLGSFSRTARPPNAMFAVVWNMSGLTYTQRRLMIIVLCVVKELHGPQERIKFKQVYLKYYGRTFNVSKVCCCAKPRKSSTNRLHIL